MGRKIRVEVSTVSTQPLKCKFFFKYFILSNPMIKSIREMRGYVDRATFIGRHEVVITPPKGVSQRQLEQALVMLFKVRIGRELEFIPPVDDSERRRQPYIKLVRGSRDGRR